MSRFRLIRTNGTMLPGGFRFTDTITGKTYGDMHTTFAGRVGEIIRDRRANARLFTDQRFVQQDHVAQELSEQNCTRLKNNRLHCDDGLPRVNDPVPAQPVMAVGKVCRWCHSDQLEEVYCATCSGRKITGYRCAKCGKENPR